MIVRVWLLVIAVLISGCTSIPTGQIISHKPIPKHPSHVQNWTIDGKLALRYKDDHLNAHFKWCKSGHDYQLRLFGPIGPGQLIIDAQNHQVKLTSTDGKIYHADTPEALLENTFQIHLPISNLFFWLRGLPVDANHAQITYDEQKQIRKIYENGWTVLYNQYQSSQSLYLPTRLHITNDELSLKVFIYKWQL